MATCQDLIDNTLLMIGAIGSGETPATQERTDAFITLNRIFASWSNEENTNFTKVFETFALTSGDGTYTWGSGGNISTTRPLRVISARVVSGAFSNGLKVLSYAKASEIARNSMGVLASLPEVLGYDNGRPLVNILIYPPPNGTPTLELTSLKPLTQFALISTTIDLPDGWEIALQYALALVLAPQYGSPFINEANAALAQSYKAAIVQQNLPPMEPGQEGSA